MTRDQEMLLREMKADLSAIRKFVERIQPNVEAHLKPIEESFLSKVFDKGAQAATVKILSDIHDLLASGLNRKSN